MHLRDYQLRCVEAVLAEWQKVQSTMVQAATGVGKTTIFCEIIRRRQPCRALVIAERRQLIKQTAGRITAETELECDIEMGFQHADNHGLLERRPVVVATVQTLCSGREQRRYMKWKPTDFDLLVIDELHHAASKSYRIVLDYFRQNKSLKVLGVTATPDRADGKSLIGPVCDSMAFKYDILDAIQDSWLVPVTQQFCPVSSLDFSHVRTTCGDLNEGDLAKIMEAEENIQGVCHPSLEVLYGLVPKTLSAIPVPEWGTYLAGLGKQPRRAIMFTVSVAQAEACANIFNRVVPGLCEWVCAQTPEDDRDAILERFRSGKTPVVANCGIYTESVDVPWAEVIFMARPTKSRGLYAQMSGRATRTVPGIVDGLATADERKTAIAASAKPRARIIDFVGNSGRHKLVCALDVLGMNSTQAAIEYAITKAKNDGKPVTVLRELSSAEIELAKKAKEAEDRARLEEEARKRKIVAKSQFHHINVDPFGRQNGFQTGHRGNRNGVRNPPTPKQLKVICRAGINPTNLTKKKASWIISILSKNKWELPEEFRWLRNPQHERASH